jgi:hypothetical protein
VKKLALAIVVVIAAWCGYSYLTTGRIGLPVTQRSDDEKKVDKLVLRLNAAQSEFRSANMAAGSAGVDTTSQAEEAQHEMRTVLDEVRSLKLELKDPAARKKAEALEQRAQSVVEKSR